MFLSAAGFVALDAVLYNITVYVSLRCRLCGADEHMAGLRHQTNLHQSGSLSLSLLFTQE